MTVVIAMYNSARFLPGLAEMLECQRNPVGVGPLEILAVDGGSTDGSRELAADLGFKVIDNPDGNAIAAKNIGLRRASARLVCILDHDETFVRDDALMRRYEIFGADPLMRAVVSSGYRFSSEESTANMYASEFGDPVSMSIYRCPNNELFRLKTFQSRLVTVSLMEDVHIFLAGSEKRPILCEIAAGSGTIDVDFFRDRHPKVIEVKNLFPHAYYLLGDDDHIGMIEGDSIQHSSADSWSIVRSKVSWRVNNAINDTSVSDSGFTGRAHNNLYSPRRHSRRFGLYAMTVIMPLFDSLYLAVTRKRVGYLNHFLLTYFVLWRAVCLKAAALVGGDLSEARYGE